MLSPHQCIASAGITKIPCNHANAEMLTHDTYTSKDACNEVTRKIKKRDFSELLFYKSNEQRVVTCLEVDVHIDWCLREIKGLADV